MQHIDDALTHDLEHIKTAVSVDNPVECLLRWGDVVTVRGKNDHRRVDATQVNALATKHGFPAG